jgi:hypothetical protein
MSVRPIYPAHELDVAWIIALWIAIHGGDSSPEVAAARAVAALAQYGNGTAQAFALEELKAHFGRLGVTVTERDKHQASSPSPQPQKMNDGEAREFLIHRYCFKFEGATICTELPVLTHLRTAA